MHLTMKQEKFAHAYVAYGDVSKACIEAGITYVTGTGMLAKPQVAKKIEELKRVYAASTYVNREKVIMELARIAFCDIRQLFDESGRLLSVDKMPEDVVRSVQAVEVEELYEGYGKDRKAIGLTKRIKFWDKKGALDSLAKMLGYNEPEKIDVRGVVAELPADISIEDLKQLAGLNGQTTLTLPEPEPTPIGKDGLPVDFMIEPVVKRPIRKTFDEPQD